MKYYSLIYFIFIFSFVGAQSDYLSNWPIYEIKNANTAFNEKYLTTEEKNVFFVLNLARINPQLFSETILKFYRAPKGFSNDFLRNKKYFNSLYSTLLDMEPLNPVLPNKKLWEYADCHAYKSGKRGSTGHKRVGCKKPKFYSECCSYGLDKAIDIVVQLLIDYQIKDLGHRKIMLDSKQKLLGVSIKSHKKYSYNAVLDFSY